MKKRNVSKIIVMIFAFILIFTSMSFADTTYDYTPVSYTHLDVYKRQIIHKILILIIKNKQIK